MGIGLACSHELARRGARVVVVARGDEAIKVPDRLTGEGHEGVRLDVADEAAWLAAMEAIDAGGQLNGLVAAAGVLGPIGALEDVEPEDFVRTIAIDLIGTVLALRHALPRLEATSGRAVTFSGGGATSPLPGFDAYAAAKVAVVRLTENVAAAGRIEMNSVAPGFVRTRIHDQTLAAGPEVAGAAYYQSTREQLRSGGFPASEAADLVAFLLSPQAKGITGRLISAQWDPWRDPRFQQRLREDPDLGRLRRIDEQFYVRRA